MKAQVKIRLLGLLCLVLLSAIVFRLTRAQDLPVSSTVFWGFVGLWLAVSSVLLFHISSLTASRYVDAHILIIQFVLIKIMNILGAFYARRHEYEFAHCQVTQERFLMKLLSRRAKTVYGRDHDFANMKSVADFRQRHPLTGYAHYAPYMERVARGEVNVVTSSKPSRIGLTSGTTGRQKLIPVSKERQSMFFYKLGSLTSYLAKKRYAPQESPLQRFCLLYVHTVPRMSDGGIPMGPITMLTVPDFLSRLMFSTPPAGMKLTNEHQAMYVHLLFALRDPTVRYIAGFFSTTIFTFFTRLEEDWPKLVDDLRRGRIGDHVGLDNDTRVVLESELDPEPERSAELEREFRKGFVGIAKRIWPHMNYLVGISSGAAAVYTRRLEKTYSKGLPVLSTAYNSTEGMLGYIDINGDDHQYVLDVSDFFYEFIPIDHGHEDQPDTLLAEELEVGQTYEFVITNMDALYRYRIGDVIKVTGFRGKSPIIDFQYRSGELLSLKGEKTPEVSIRLAVTETFASDALENVVLAEYACVESVLYEEATGVTEPNAEIYYVIFVEVENVDIVCSGNKREEATSQLEARLRHHAAGYNYQRKRDGIASLKVVFVHPGSFTSLRAHVLANSGASAGQVKIPKKLLKAEWVRLLAERQVDRQ